MWTWISPSQVSPVPAGQPPAPSFPHQLLHSAGAAGHSPAGGHGAVPDPHGVSPQELRLGAPASSRCGEPSRQPLEALQILTEACCLQRLSGLSPPGEAGWRGGEVASLSRLLSCPLPRNRVPRAADTVARTRSSRWLLPGLQLPKGHCLPVTELQGAALNFRVSLPQGWAQVGLSSQVSRQGQERLRTWASDAFKVKKPGLTHQKQSFSGSAG